MNNLNKDPYPPSRRDTVLLVLLMVALMLGLIIMVVMA